MYHVVFVGSWDKKIPFGHCIKYHDVKMWYNILLSWLTSFYLRGPAVFKYVLWQNLCLRKWTFECAVPFWPAKAPSQMHECWELCWSCEMLSRCSSDLEGNFFSYAVSKTFVPDAKWYSSGAVKCHAMLSHLIGVACWYMLSLFGAVTCDKSRHTVNHLFGNARKNRMQLWAPLSNVYKYAQPLLYSHCCTVHFLASLTKNEVKAVQVCILSFKPKPLKKGLHFLEQDLDFLFSWLSIFSDALRLLQVIMMPLSSGSGDESYSPASSSSSGSFTSPATQASGLSLMLPSKTWYGTYAVWILLVFIFSVTLVVDALLL